jgi:hypothetical protein
MNAGKTFHRKVKHYLYSLYSLSLFHLEPELSRVVIEAMIHLFYAP